MNEENEREQRVEEVTIVDQEVAKVSKAEVRRASKRMKSEKAVGPDDTKLHATEIMGKSSRS